MFRYDFYNKQNQLCVTNIIEMVQTNPYYLHSYILWNTLVSVMLYRQCFLDWFRQQLEQDITCDHYIVVSTLCKDLKIQPHGIRESGFVAGPSSQIVIFAT